MPTPDDLQQRLDAAAGTPPDTSAALSAVAARINRSPRRGQHGVAIAAALLLIAGSAWVVVQWQASDNGESVRTGPTSQGAEPATPVDFTVLSQSIAARQSIGDLRSAGTATELAELWRDAGAAGSVPTVDLDQDAVVSITIGDDLCPPTLERFSRRGTTLQPRFTEPPGACEKTLVPRTFVVALGWKGAGDAFTLLTKDEPTRLTVTRAPQPALSARAVLPSTTIASGPTTKGTVKVHNNTGHAIKGSTCGDFFTLTLSNGTISQGDGRLLCLTPFALPTGESSHGINLSATIQCVPGGKHPIFAACEPDGSLLPLPPGNYTATLNQGALEQPIPEPKPFNITIT